MIPSKLRTAAAKFSLGIATTEELIDAAHDALDRGLHCHSLGELATQHQPSRHESERLFAGVIGELNIDFPSRRDVFLALFDQTAREMLEGVRSTFEVLTEFNECHGNHRFADIIQEFKDIHLYRRNWSTNHLYLEILSSQPGDDIRHLGPSNPPNEESLLQSCHDSALRWLRYRFLPQLQPAFLTPTVRGLVSAIREDCAFDRLPILADALQEAGCEREEILTHLREQNPHERCCWVAELLAEVT